MPTGSFSFRSFARRQSSLLQIDIVDTYGKITCAMSDIAIRVEHLSKLYRLGSRERYKTLRDALTDTMAAPLRAISRLHSGDHSQHSDNFIWALKDVSFEVKRGEVIGIIGRNGAGKSTLLKILSHITEPTEGHVEIHGRVASLLEIGTGFHPELTGRENIYLSGAILGMKKMEIARRFDEIVAFAEIEKFLDTPVKHYSSGMYVRLAFAVAAHLEPEILLIDEVLAVGDAVFQQKCLGRMNNVAREGRTVLFVSHNMAAIQNLCNVAYLIDQGKVSASGNVSEVIGRYLQASNNAQVEGKGVILLDRKDRQGNGKLRFVDISIQSQTLASTTVICGEPISFVIKYQGTAPLHNVHIAIGLYTLLGDGVIYLSNDLTGKRFDNLPSAGSFVSRFEKFPLLPGTYVVNLYSTVNGILADWVIDATRLYVTEGDYFGTGKLPPKGYGGVVVDHAWDVIEN
jgi:lipopolysaccharide transport system ATP-binding protein